MKELTDLIGKKVTIVIKDMDDIEGILKSIENGGYCIEEEDGTFHFIPEANNVIKVYYQKPE